MHKPVIEFMCKLTNLLLFDTFHTEEIFQSNNSALRHHHYTTLKKINEKKHSNNNGASR